MALPQIPDIAALIAALIPPGTPIEVIVDPFPGSSLGFGSVTLES
ncbi:hypothetical protein [Rhodococcus gannanensis]|jgi:hypothetical protein|uniref:Uncharacterized protein n=1 Tax=Rhodococcus gannanensis TaxID=1960308 RepID=A0ABW4P8R8_9NOCA